MTVTLFAVTVGSRAFGLDSADSDYDVRVVEARTPADLYSPYPMERDEAPALEGGTYGGTLIQTQALDYGTFVRKLADNELNAWVTLMSNMTESGRLAQMELRDLALDHLADSEKLLSNAKRRAVAMLHEARLKHSGKVAANGLAFLIFAWNMAQFGVANALNLGTLRDDLRAIKFHNQIDHAETVMNTLLSTSGSYHREPDPEHSYVNERFMAYYHRWVE